MCVYLSSFGVSYGYELLSDDRQHFNVDSVKFVKTTPSTGLSKPTKEAPHYLEERSVNLLTIRDRSIMVHSCGILYKGLGCYFHFYFEL